MIKLSLVVALALGSISLEAQTVAGTGRTLIRTGHLVDVHTGAEPAGQTIIVSGDRIVSIVPTAQTPATAGDRELDLTRYTVLPGLFDVHTHVTMAPNFDPYLSSR